MLAVRCCPSCHRVFSESIEFCASDGTELIEITHRRDPLVGLVLDGRYQLRSLLGAGGMGFVYLAHQTGLGREVAVKMLYAERTRDKNSVRRFRREAIALAGIDHPSVVRVLEYGDGGGTTPYIVMEKVSGRALDEVILVMRILAPRHAVHICAELAEGLAAAHGQGVVHRDLKPSNIQLEAKGEELTVRILDFGLALLAEGHEGGSTGGGRLTRQGVIFGTPEYMSPEQIKGKGADSRSDLYSLGCVLYELLVGTPPFVGVTNIAVLGMHIEEPPPRLSLPDLEPALVEDLDAVVRGLLEKNPEKRLGDAGRIARRLRDLEKRLPNPGSLSSLANVEALDHRPADSHRAARTARLPVEPLQRAAVRRARPHGRRRPCARRCARGQPKVASGSDLAPRRRGGARSGRRGSVRARAHRSGPRPGGPGRGAPVSAPAAPRQGATRAQRRPRERASDRRDAGRRGSTEL